MCTKNLVLATTFWSISFLLSHFGLQQDYWETQRRGRAATVACSVMDRPFQGPSPLLCNHCITIVHTVSTPTNPPPLLLPPWRLAIFCFQTTAVRQQLLPSLLRFMTAICDTGDISHFRSETLNHCRLFHWFSQ